MSKEATIRELHIANAKRIQDAANPPHGPNRTHTDYAAQIAAHNPVTLREANILRTTMIEDAPNKAARQQIADAFAPVLERLRLVE
jgi:hypothetical protein